MLLFKGFFWARFWMCVRACCSKVSILLRGFLGVTLGLLGLGIPLKKMDAFLD